MAIEKTGGQSTPAQRPENTQVKLPIKERTSARKSIFTVDDENGQKRQIEVYDQDNENFDTASSDYNKTVTDAFSNKEPKTNWYKNTDKFGSKQELESFVDKAYDLFGAENPQQKDITEMAEAMNNWNKAVLQNNPNMSEADKQEYEGLLSKAAQMVGAAGEMVEEKGKPKGKKGDVTPRDGNRTQFTVKDNNGENKNFFVYDRDDTTEAGAQEEAQGLARKLTEDKETSWDKQARGLAGDNEAAKSAVDKYLETANGFLNGDISSVDSVKAMVSSLRELNNAIRSGEMSPEQEMQLNRLLEQGFQVVGSIVDVAEEQGYDVNPKTSVKKAFKGFWGALNE